MKKCVLLPLLCLVGFLASAQQERQFSQDQLHEDLEFLKESIETYNPALGVFHDRAVFEAVYDSLYRQLDRPLTELEFYPYLVRLAAASKEGHTLIGSTRDTTYRFLRGFFDGSFHYLPISFYYHNNEARLLGNFSPDSTLLRGDEILAINGRSIPQLIGDLKPYAITDGDIEAVKTNKVLNSFGSFYYWFIGRPEQFEITYRSVATKPPQKVVLPALPRDSMLAWRDRRYGVPSPKEASIADVYEFRMEDNTAWLDLKTFERSLKDRYQIKPRKLYREIFRELREKQVDHLVIDVRDNTGGRREYARHLLPYLMKEPRKGVVYQDVSWKGKEGKNTFPKRSKWAFTGEIYVLVNHNSFSNGSVVAQYAKVFGGAQVIGAETASRFEGFAAGSRQTVFLPHTGIRVRIPRYLLLHTDPLLQPETPNRGVLPDVPITYSFEELLSGRDKEVEKVREMMNK